MTFEPMRIQHEVTRLVTLPWSLLLEVCDPNMYSLVDLVIFQWISSARLSYLVHLLLQWSL